MIIIFNITYPDQIDPVAAKKILQLLPQQKTPPLPKDTEEVQLEVFDGKLVLVLKVNCNATVLGPAKQREESSWDSAQSLLTLAV